MDKLARALLKLRGLGVTNTQASQIQELYLNLSEFDKKPLVFSPSVHQAPRGRFARSKSKAQSIIGIDHMKKYVIPITNLKNGFLSLPLYRCFLSAGSPATSPSKSRVVEALCILLTEKHPNPRRHSSPGRRRMFTSRWNLVLSEYNAIRTRLFNSQALEGTHLALYAINEATLVRIYSIFPRWTHFKKSKVHASCCLLVSFW